MKNIIVLGSTGSIGKNALEIIKNKKKDFKLIGISGNKNVNLLMKQIEEFNPKYVTVGSVESCKVLKSVFPKVTFFYGNEGLVDICNVDDYDVLLTGVSGSVGIEATLAAIKKQKRIALANKETMVAAGELINSYLKKYKKAEIIPVDSEHSAIFQALKGENVKNISKLIITASGGTFRGKTSEELSNVTVKEALNHPNWSMGKKITIDSSTLVNKGLEVIEAHELFGIDYDNIEVLVHPQSIIHSMVEFKDNSIIAQMGVPDMKGAIQYAFTHPNRIKNSIIQPLDFLKIKELTFEKPDTEVFKGLKFAYDAGKIGKSMPAVFNAANEIATDLFLNKKIKFLDIYEIIYEAMSHHTPIDIDTIEAVREVDKETREIICKKWRKNG